MGRTGINTLAAEHTPFLIKAELPVRIEREDFTGTDADARPAVHTFALIKADAIFENVHPCTETYHRIAYQFALIIRYINECFSFR